MFRFACLLTLLGASAALVAQEKPGKSESLATPALRVEVPTFANSTCPIMGKKVSMKLFTDTEVGRMYICCKGCDKKIQKDVPTAYKTAYPTTKHLDNATCPVSGEKVGDKPVEVTLQGHAFKVCCADCVPETKRNAQVVLARVTDDKVTDLRNAECPITSQPVVDNAFVLVGDTLLRLSSPQCVDEVTKDPSATLAKAKALAASKQLDDPRKRAPESAPAAPKEASGRKKESGK